MAKDLNELRNKMMKDMREHRLHQGIGTNQNYIAEYLKTLTHCLTLANPLIQNNVNSDDIVKRMSEAFIKFRTQTLEHQDEYQYMGKIDDGEEFTGDKND